METLTLTQLRQISVRAQRLCGPPAPPTPAGLLAVARALRAIQLDPISVVARSHQLVWFSRVGPYPLAALDHLLWHDRALFEYWAHCASIVLTEDYPIHANRMRAYARPTTSWGERRHAWVNQNAALKRALLRTLRLNGPTLSRDLTERGHAPTAWISTGWTSGRNITLMLDFLWQSGQIIVAGRAGLQKKWDLAERCLPAWTPRQRHPETQTTRLAVQHALRALGVATPRQIQNHFVRGRYPEFDKVWARLLTEGWAVPVRTPLKGQWFMPAEHLPWLAEPFAPRTVLLSPFDNLIADRARTAAIFGFDYRIEIYTPAAKRRFGYYVLPLLHGEALVARLDPTYDTATRTLTLNALHWEPGVNHDLAPVRAALTDLATFLGAQRVLAPTQPALTW